MFGITSPSDWIAVGTIFGAAVLALLGQKDGKTLRNAADAQQPLLDATAGMLADKSLTMRLVVALEIMASCMTTLLKEQQDAHKREVDKELGEMKKILLDLAEDKKKAAR